MGNFKTILNKLGFEEYMAPYVILCGMSYIYGVIKFFGMITSFKGVIIFIAFVIGEPLLMFIVLKLFQTVCRLVGVNKIYASIKKRK